MLTRKQIRQALLSVGTAAALVFVAGAQVAVALDSAGRMITPPPHRASPRPRAVVSATITPTPPQPAARQVVHCDNLIQNGGFEAPPSGRPWTGVANTPRTVYRDPLVTTARARTGRQSARIGQSRLGNYWSELIQTVQLPDGIASVTLTYWRFLDISRDSAFSIGLESDAGIQAVTPQRLSRLSAGRGMWVKGTLTLPKASAWSGKRLWVSVKGTTGSRQPSSLYVDDVQLTVCALQ